jgi:hypothetical protein
MGDSQARANPSSELIIIRKEQFSHLSLLEGIYCNRADTHWYTTDKVRLPDRRKPPNKRNSQTHQYGLDPTQANS